MTRHRLGRLSALTRGAALVGLGVAGAAGCVESQAPQGTTATAPAPTVTTATNPSDPSPIPTTAIRPPGDVAPATTPAASGTPIKLPGQLNAVRKPDAGP